MNPRTVGEAMDAFQAHYADIRDPAQQPRIAAQLRDQGLVTFGGIADPAALAAAAGRLMAIRPHRDAGPDGVTVIADTRANDAGYAAFTDAELIPHTDGSSVPDPPGLLLLACQRPADQGGTTLLADGARIIGTLAEQYPAALSRCPHLGLRSSGQQAATAARSASRTGPAGPPSGSDSTTLPGSPSMPPSPSRCCAP